MSGKRIEVWLQRFQSSKTWLSKRYSPERIQGALEEWVEVFEIEAGAQGVPIDNIEPLEYFRPSYLRLSQGPKRRLQLRTRARAAVRRISKRKLLEHVRRVAGNEAFDAARLEKWSHERIVSRFAAWEKALRAALPDLSEDDVFRHFRLRYLYLPEDRFHNEAVPLGIKNAQDLHGRLTALKGLGIDPQHPEYERWLSLAHWQFWRKARMLRGAADRFGDLTLGFPPTSESLNQRDYHRYLSVCANGDEPNRYEEAIYKLLLYFGGVTEHQLGQILSLTPKAGPWRSFDVEPALARLVELGLVEEQNHEAQPWYQPSRSIHTELILETWLQKLRGRIKIGTREALDYLPSGYQRHQVNVIARRDIPRATERIMRDRRRLVTEMGIDRNDPRYGNLIARGRRDIESMVEDYRRVVERFERGDLHVSHDLENQLNIFFDEDLKPDDRDVFILVVNLGRASMGQISKILRRHGGSRRGFALKSSLKRLCAVELFFEDKDGLYTLHPSLEDLGSTEDAGWSDLTRVVGLL